MKTPERRDHWPFTVQAWSNVDGWQSTVYGGETYEQALTAANSIPLSSWINGKPTKVQIIQKPLAKFGTFAAGLGDQQLRSNLR